MIKPLNFSDDNVSFGDTYTDDGDIISAVVGDDVLASVLGSGMGGSLCRENRLLGRTRRISDDPTWETE